MKPTGGSVFVTLENALQEKITFASGAEIYLPSWLDIEGYATCHGIVHSVGERCLLDLNKGDEVAVSYQLVADYQRVGDQVIYNRCLLSEGEAVWKADYLDEFDAQVEGRKPGEHMVMAKKVDGQWQALGDYVLLQEAEEKPTVKTSLILTGLSQKKADNYGYFVSGNLPIQKGAKVYWGNCNRTNPASFKSIYTFPDGSKYIILNNRYIMAYEDTKG